MSAGPLTRNQPAAVTRRPGPMHDVHIAIVSHGHFRYLDECLSSIYQNTHYASVTVTLVDNIAQPEVAALVADKFDQVRFVVNARPKGFSENNNSAFEGVDARYCFLLNPDTVINPGAIDAMVAHMDAHPDVGACAPKLVYPDGRLQLSCRQFPSIGTVLFRRTPLRVLFGNTKTARSYLMMDWDHASCRSIDWMFGAAIFVRRETWQSVGPLDTSMFLFCEDIDWCLRCHQAGWDIHYVPHSVIVHDFDEDKYNKYLTKGRMKHYKTMLQFFIKYPRYCLRW